MRKCRISFDVLIAFRKHYEEVLTQFKKKFTVQITKILEITKTTFWMNSGTIKYLLLIHSRMGK